MAKSQITVTVMTAFEAAADWWWTRDYSLRMYPRGRALYCEAFTKGDNGNVKLSPEKTGVSYRYVSPDALIELVKKQFAPGWPTEGERSD